MKNPTKSLVHIHVKNIILFICAVLLGLKIKLYFVKIVQLKFLKIRWGFYVNMIEKNIPKWNK